MSIFGDLLGVGGVADAAKAITGTIGDVIKRFIPDPDKALEAKVETEKIIAAGLTSQMQAMQAVMTADSQSTSIYTSGARPTVVYWSLGMITLLVGLGTFGHADHALMALKAVPDNMWTMITYGIGIFAAGRTVEKSTTTIANAITSVIAKRVAK